MATIPHDSLSGMSLIFGKTGNVTEYWILASKPAQH
jgi:hypothetical protein